MKKRVTSVLFVVAFLGFIAIMDYPFIARFYNERVQGMVAVEYENETEKKNEETRLAEWEEADKYNQSLASGTGQAIRDIFEDKTWDHSEYDALLNTGKDGVMGLIEIPKIHVTLPVYHGTSEDVLQKGAGHLEGTSLPVGGTDTHTVLSAHRGLPEKKMFTNLDQLEAGDVFYIHVLGEILAYEVTSVETVRPDETEPLKICAGKDMATLLTCTPYGINTHRMYVHGERIPYVETVREAEAEVKPKDFWNNYWWIAVTLLLLLWMGILLWRFEQRED